MAVLYITIALRKVHDITCGTIIVAKDMVNVVLSFSIVMVPTDIFIIENGYNHHYVVSRKRTYILYPRYLYFILNVCWGLLGDGFKIYTRGIKAYRYTVYDQLLRFTSQLCLFILTLLPHHPNIEGYFLRPLTPFGYHC